MLKSKIFIAMHYMEIGGAEMALVGLLNALDSKKVDVDLFLYDQRGELMKFIPKWINIIPPISKYTVLERPIKELLKRGYWGIALARLLAKTYSKISYKRSGSLLENGSGQDSMSKFTTPFLPRINTTIYDLAISFHAPHRIILCKVAAKKKLAWIHTDYTRIWINKIEELKVWQKYNYIASISSDVTKTFLRAFPSLAPKIIEIENILSPTFVENRAMDFNPEREICPDIQRFPSLSAHDAHRVTILSIGRFCEAKNYDNVPDITRRLIEEGDDVKWFIIGFGQDENIIRQKIAESGMQEHVIILGKKENPYPYIKACDIYVQPSRYEGKSVTVREAQMLCKPVVVTNYPTASSQIKDGIDGVIVPLDNEGCAKGIAGFIRDIDKQSRIKEYLRTHDYGNESEVGKIYNILDM